MTISNLASTADETSKFATALRALANDVEANPRGPLSPRARLYAVVQALQGDVDELDAVERSFVDRMLAGR
jgi:regulator of sirC expression with transglutaminase-like and TPR domain